MRWLATVVLVTACGDNAPPPVEVHSGRLVARITPEPARIELVLDGDVAWATTDGFATIGTVDADIAGEFGAFKFEERPTSTRAIDRLADIVENPEGATFALVAGDDRIATGELAFVRATHSGPGSETTGFARHVRIRIATEAGDRVALASVLARDEHLVGLGGQSFDVDHRGETVPLWVEEDGITKFPDPDDDYAGWPLSGRKHSTHTPMPMVLSSRGYAVAVDTNARAIFGLADVARYEAWDRALDVQVFVGDGPRDRPHAGEAARDALGHMIAWTGKAARPPIGVFAPWVDAIRGSANVRRIAQQLRDSGIAASAIWTEDWRGGGATPDGKDYVLEEDWRVDAALYPDFAQLADDLHAQGYAFLTYQNTFIDDSADIAAEATDAGYSIHAADGGPRKFIGVKFNQSTMLDLTNPAAVAWGQGVMSEALALGGDGWMADFGEWLPADAVLASGEDARRVHNRYPVDWARYNRELFAGHVTPGRPPAMYFMRSAWLHSQPEVQVIWPGDQQTDFSDGDGLPSVIPMAINLGLAGFPYFGSDIAGYMSAETAPVTTELFQRWVTFGALQPVMRTHHGRSALANVQWDHDAGTIAHFRRWTRLHMQLVPYQLGLIASYERDGLPLLRMVALEYPDDDWAWTTTDEYLLGDRILVAPEIRGAPVRHVTLPAGTWYPLLGGAAVTGELDADVPLTEIPAFVPAGTLLVLYPDGVDTVLDAPGAPAAVTARTIGADREVWLYPGTGARGTWNDELGALGDAQWTWSGRPEGPIPDVAVFDITPVASANGVFTVVGDGTLAFPDGSTLVIARGDPTARVAVRLR